MVLSKLFLNQRKTALIFTGLKIDKRSFSKSAECALALSDLSYAHGASSTPFLNFTIGQQLRFAVDECPDQMMVISKHCNVRKTYAELFADARQLAASLIHLGVKKGDRVGIWGPNYYEWLVTQFGTAIAGMILVNINPAYQSEELRFALHKVGVKAIITPPAYKTSNYKRTLYEIVPEMATGVEGIGKIHSKSLPELQHAILFKSAEKVKGFWNYDDLLGVPTSEDFAKLDENERNVRFDDPVNIQYTSGTTGYPKAATLTHHNIVNNSYFIGMRMESDKRNETVCLPVPLYHSFGSVGMLKVLNHRETAVLPSPTFNAEATLKAIAEEKCTLLYGTPTMFIDVLNRPELPKTDISSLHGGIIAGAPCPISLCQRMVKELNMKDFVVCYGSTEISPVVAMSHLSESPEERCKSVGHVLDHLEMAIFDKNNQIVERGEMGEIVARGYSVMQGYFNDDEKTREAITADRWYHTGDTGFMNPDGSVVISGRSKDMIIRGGENIYPTEIEQLLHKHPEIDDVHVIGVPDQRLGEEICAWIRLATHSKLTPEKVKEFCQGKISHNKIPKYILFKKESDFPLTATGKVMKHELKKLSQHELGLEQVKSHFNC